MCSVQVSSWSFRSDSKTGPESHSPALTVGLCLVFGSGRSGSVLLWQPVSGPLGFLSGWAPAGAAVYRGCCRGDKGSASRRAWTVPTGSEGVVAKPRTVTDQQHQQTGDRLHRHHQVNTRWGEHTHTASSNVLCLGFVVQVCFCVTAQVWFGRWSQRIVGNRSVRRTSTCWRRRTRVSSVGRQKGAGSNWTPTWRSEVTTDSQTELTWPPHSETKDPCDCHWSPGESQPSHHDDASAVFLPSEEELPVWDPGGVQTVTAPAQSEGPAALAAGKYTHTHTQKHSLTCMTDIVSVCRWITSYQVRSSPSSSILFFLQNPSLWTQVDHLNNLVLHLSPVHLWRLHIFSTCSQSVVPLQCF